MLINTLSLTHNAHSWLRDSRQPRILHIFDRACNLISERGEVLSIVTQKIGNGPFNLVVEEDTLFSGKLIAESPVSIHATQLHIGDLIIRTEGAKLWDARPDWEDLHRKRKIILAQLDQLEITDVGFTQNPKGKPRITQIVATSCPKGKFAVKDFELRKSYNDQFANSLVSNLSSVFASADIESAKAVASQLAGLGQGLTPSGDDILLGTILAVWIIHPLELAAEIAKEIANIAAPLTTSLSAAWLRSAGNGEAGVLWHEFFSALLDMNIVQAQMKIDKILVVGETSGADALSGFVDTFNSYAEREKKLCHS